MVAHYINTENTLTTMGSKESTESIRPLLDGLYLATSATCTVDFSNLAFCGKPHPTNCPNCGAPAKQQECEYCGSILW